MKFNCLISFSLLLLICACSSNSSKRSLVKLPNLNGIWKGNLQLSDEKTLPFNFSIENDSIHFYNAKEKISTIIRADSAKKYTVKMPVFNSAFSFQKVGEKLEGFWINYSKSDQYKITFSAVQIEDLTNRFHPSNYYENKNLDGSWEVTFGPNSVNEFKAIGLFNQSPEMLSGTFLTETGDYRFLQGNYTEDSLLLSCFDGSHAFLFEARLTNDSLNGIFYSGNHYKENWIATKNDSFTLSDPYAITTLDRSIPVEFSFLDTDSMPFSFPSDRFLNKVVIVQIIGSWCPNCLDETVFFTKLYNKHNSNGLEVISLAYEKSDSFEKKVARVKSLKEHCLANYPFLIAGNSSKKEVEKTLPFLQNVASFPTTIYIDKSGKVRRIYSGFFGPGTGKYHEIFSKETNLFVESLLKEEIID